MRTIETLAVIPARLGSTRLPEKPLVKLCGRELVLRVLDGVRACRSVDRAIVATDSERVVSLVERDGGEAMMTPADLPTGSDRVAWVAERVPSEYVLNVQGDDPMVCPAHIDPMIEALRGDPGTGLAVLAKKIDDPTETARDSIVKMVFATNGRALYFSRAPIPYPRAGEAVCYKHIGPYAWRRDALFAFAAMPRTPLERTESLEMLRLLENGGTIRCIETEIDCIEIDTPEDVRLFEEFFANKG
jgi:3-deoxy-manno-octulosonate cytidylyltransferase (CMP-KDO synthetase)